MLGPGDLYVIHSNSNRRTLIETETHRRVFEQANRQRIWYSNWLGTNGKLECTLAEDEKTITVRPNAFPIKAVGIWMHTCIFMFMLGGWLFQAPLIFWFMMAAGALVIVPTMMGFFLWVNKELGDSPYLLIHKRDEFIELPRLGEKWAIKDSLGVYFVRCYVEGNPFFQVSLLIQNGFENWTYAHVYNEGGDNHRIHWMFGHGLSVDQEIAKRLGIGWHYLRFRSDGTLAQERTLDNNRNRDRGRIATDPSHTT